ncbi:MAG: aspartate dehydrogenase domain-containing protein, partial [Candidatus Omnitrophota bacterium]
VSLYDVDLEKTYSLANKLDNNKLVALNPEDLINKVDLVIEATKMDSVFDIAKKAISSLKDIMIISAGGAIKHFSELQALAEEKNVRVFIPSGAISGIDGLKASACSKIHKVILTTKKPPKAFFGVPYVLKRKIRLDNISEETVIFEGDALTAIRAFPQNVNVAATLSMAGIGPESTIVRIVASPKIDKNMHEIEIQSEAGTIFSRTENLIHPDNPKTSYLAVLSAIATLKQILSPIKIGT